MAWRAGAELFADVWPLIQYRVRDRRQRHEFTASLLRLLVEHDTDPTDVADLHPEVRAALASIGIETPHESEAEQAVIDCARHLESAEASARATAAEALRHFAPLADEPRRAAVHVLPALIKLLRDPVPRVARAAAMSVRELVPVARPIPTKIMAKLRAAARHADEVVAKRIREAIVRAERA
ncbi:HEAT repeat domain-containing protein [Gemmata sp.]|uniref:HEAT repeat domain-containing protein n=1 Tax=Gemmata sp. TaxID=1914242 RepID=UPI003F715D62